MTWRGCDPAIEITSLDELRSYIRSLDYGSWRPSNFAIHNTASPTLHQWWNSVPPAQRMENLRDYYENEMGWSAGPHAFIDGKSWWIFTPFNVKGVHSPSWNGTMLGFECVGDYNIESDETGMGAEVMKMAHQLSAEVCDYFGWDPENLKFHKEDPATDHDCPGSNMVKSEFIDDVQQVMGDGGDDQDRPTRPHRGIVSGLVEGDTLNVRAAASSSSTIIGEAENGDILTIVGEAMNGSTRWLRIQVGQAAGTDLAIFGWVSAAYVTEGRPVSPGFPENQQNIICTVFGGASDPNNSAYPPYDVITNSERSVALPARFSGDERPMVRVFNTENELSVLCQIRDIGPWYTDDAYWITGTRPRAEPAGSTIIGGPNDGRTSNGAGIDLTPAAASAIGIEGKGVVHWMFDEEELFA